jgi:very-short-patch-repair endonuclease
MVVGIMATLMRLKRQVTVGSVEVQFLVHDWRLVVAGENDASLDKL